MMWGVTVQYDVGGGTGEVGRRGGTRDARGQTGYERRFGDDELSDIDSESDFSDTDQDMSSDDDDTIVGSDAMVTGDELSRNEEGRGASRIEEGGEGGRRGAASLVHTPNLVLMSALGVLMSTQPPLEIQGEAASENPGSVETNLTENAPSGNEGLEGEGYGDRY